MIHTIALTLVRQRLASPMRVVLAITLFGFGVLSVLFTGSLDTLVKSEMGAFGLVFAAGLIGQEVSSGVLTLVFARPVRRAEYVLGRWLGACALGSALVLLEVLVAAGALLMRHGEPTLPMVASKVLEGVLAVIGSSTVLLMFSSLVAGLGDLALLLLGSLVSVVLSTAGMHSHSTWLSRAGAELQGFLSASIDPAPLFGVGAISWFEVTSYLSTLSICLVVAIWAVNRRELSYASG